MTMSALNLLADNYQPPNAGEATEQPSTFTDVLSAGFTMTRDNYNTNAASRLIGELRDENFNEYERLTGSKFNASDFDYEEELPRLSTRDAFMQFTDPNRSLIDKETFATEKFDVQVQKLRESDPDKYGSLKTYQEIQDQARANANMSSQEFQNVVARATEDSAFYGSIAGSLGGAMTDPLNLVTMPLGAARGASVLRTIGTEAGVQAGVELAAQPAVAKWQKELGQEYDLGDAATNVFAAAIVGGGFAGIVKGIQPTAQATFALMQSSKTFNAGQKQAAAYMSRFAHVKEANPAPRTTNELHSDSVDAVNRAVKEGRSPSDIELPMTQRMFDEIDADNTRGLTRSEKTTLADVKKFQTTVEPSFNAKIKSDIVPVVETDQVPPTVSQAQQMSQRLESPEFDRSRETSFTQLVEAEPNKVIDLEDTQVKLSDLKTQLDEEQKFIDEITTCAIG